MAGTTVTTNLGGWGGSGNDSAIEQAVALLNEFVDDLETFRAAMATANGAAVSIAVLTARRIAQMDAILQSITPATPDTTPATVAVNAGDAQSAVVGTAVSTPPSVVVRNAAATALPGVIVTWTTSDIEGVLSSSQSITDASGIASILYTVGTQVGDQTVTATVNALTATFDVTSTVGAAANITAVSVTDQSAVASGVVAAPPSVRITDAYGNAVAGTTVTFAVTAGGGSRTPATVDSGADGIATLTSWTMGASAGLNTLTATAAGLTGSPATFNANAVAAAPTQIAIQSGGAQTGVTAGAAATATVSRVKDVSNNAVEGVTVTATVTTGSGTLDVASAVTDASGDVSFTYTTHTTAETATLRFAFTNASGVEVAVTTTIASVAGTATKLVIATQPASNGNSGEVLSGQPVIHVTDANGNVATGATNSIAAAIGTGNATISAGTPKAAVAGVATFTALTLGDTDGGANTIVFSTAGLTSATSTGVTLAPPVPVALQFVTQPSNVTEDVAGLSCGVWIVDENNVVVPGGNNAITVALTTPGGATLTGTLTVNATSGVANFSGLTVDTVGTYTLTATASGLTSAVSTSFTVSAASGTNEPAGMSAWSTGDLSTQALNTAFGTGGASHLGWQWYTGGGNMRVQTISDQSWRTVGTTMPACPNGQDRVLVCRMAPSGGGITAGEKGLAEKTPPAGTKSLYGRYYALVSSNWRGNPISGLKRHYVKTATAGPLIMMYYGQNGGSLGFRAHYQAPNANQVLPSTGLTMVRNTWYLFEYLVVLPTTANGTDGHVTIWLDGVKVYQRTDASFDATTLGRQQWLHYMGGSGSTDTNAVQYCLTGDAFYFSTSTSRVAIP